MAGGAQRGTGIESLPGAPPSDFGRYQVFATLGRGGMADVYLAVAHGPMGFSKLVVIKRLRAHLADEPGFRDMFLDEARLAARLNHPNVIQSYEVGESHGSYFIAMEHLDGQPLDRLLADARSKGAPLDDAVAARILADACNGLSHAHELRDYDGTPLRIIHRDVSPHNVFVSYDGQVKLVDFGIAKAALSRTETEAGVLKGKVAYMAPEQAMGGDIDARADLFAMGVVLWETLAGRALYPSDNAANTLHRLLNEPIARPSTVRAEVDPGLEAIAMRALEKDPEARFQSAREMREALEAWLGASGRGVRNEDVGDFVATAFASTRAQVQREIQRYMSEAARPASGGRTMSLASIGQLERAGGNAREQLANLSIESGAGVVSGLEPRVSGLPAAMAGERRKRRLFALAGGLGLAACLLVLALDRAPAQHATPTAPVSAVSASSEITPVAPATAAPPTAAPQPPEASSASATPIASIAVPPSHTTRGTKGGKQPSPRSSPVSAPSVPADGSQGYLTFDTYPWTRVSEAGRVIGTTPLVHVPLGPGTHVLSLENADLGIRQSYTVVVESGGTVTRRLGLQ